MLSECRVHRNPGGRGKIERHPALGLDTLSCLLVLTLMVYVPLGHWLMTSVLLALS